MGLTNADSMAAGSFIVADLVDRDVLRLRIGTRQGQAPEGALPVSLPLRPATALHSKGAVTMDGGWVVHTGDSVSILSITAPDGSEVFCLAKNPISVSDTDIRLRLTYRSDELINGLGQTAMQRLDLRDTERRMWHEVRSGPLPCITGIPFMLSSKGYGLLLCTSYPSRFVIGQAKLAPPPALAKQALFAPAPWPIGVSSQEEAEDRISIVADCTSVEVYIVLGESSKNILSRYARLVGLPRKLPEWGLGYIQSRNRYRNQNELLQLARAFRSYRVPCDVLVIDWYWFKEFGDFDWDTSNWAQPRQMIDSLRELGFKVMISLHPYVDRASSNWQSFADAGALITYPPQTRALTSHDGLLDVTHPAGAQVLRNAVARLVADGCSAWWVDQTQPEVHPEGTQHHIGSREKVHNIYPDLFTAALSEGQHTVSDARTFTLSFAAYVGAAKYGVVTWTGDVDPTWEVLAEQVVIGQQLSLSGLPYWTTDMGGYVHYPHYDPELYIRWMQWGVFCPVFRTHTKRPEAEPWSFGDAVLDHVRTTIRLRYSLIPYLVQLMHETATHGVPMVRPLFMEFPNDLDSIGRDHQFMLGTDVLVSPVLRQGIRRIDVYLPPGEWFDGWEGHRIRGGRNVSTFAPLARVPFFIRAGAVLPFDEEPTECVKSSPHSFGVRIYPGDASTTVFHFDDGLTDSYETVAPAQLKFTHSSSLDKITVTAATGGKISYLPKILVLLLQAQTESRIVTFSTHGSADTPLMNSKFLANNRTIQITIFMLELDSYFELNLSDATNAVDK